MRETQGLSEWERAHLHPVVLPDPEMLAPVDGKLHSYNMALELCFLLTTFETLVMPMLQIPEQHSHRTNGIRPLHLLKAPTN